MLIYPKPLNKQAGMMLLEGLIAILVFSLGILALVGMQAVAVKQVTDAKYRSDASLLVDQLLGTMWVSNRDSAALKTKFDTATSTDADLASWKTAVATALPGIAANVNQPTVNVFASPGAGNDGTVTITVFWLAPGEASGTQPHRYVSIAQIR